MMVWNRYTNDVDAVVRIALVPVVVGTEEDGMESDRGAGCPRRTNLRKREIMEEYTHPLFASEEHSVNVDVVVVVVVVDRGVAS